MVTLFEELLESSRKDNLIQSIYRFQGGNSIEKINFSQGHFSYNEPNSYVYFSKTFNHHKYFASRRLSQFINEVALKDSNLKVSKNSLTNIENFKALKVAVKNFRWIEDISSLEFCVHPFFMTLLEENTISSKRKISQTKLPEKVDGRKYNGGYGICGEWMELMECFTFFVKTKEVKNEHLLLFLNNLRKTTANSQIYHRIDNTMFLQSMRGRIHFNEAAFDPFAKYRIMDCIERIYDKGLYLEGSRFSNNPKQLLRQSLDIYEKSRSKCLTKLSRLSSKRIT